MSADIERQKELEELKGFIRQFFAGLREIVSSAIDSPEWHRLRAKLRELEDVVSAMEKDAGEKVK